MVHHTKLGETLLLTSCVNEKEIQEEENNANSICQKQKDFGLKHHTKIENHNLH